MLSCFLYKWALLSEDLQRNNGLTLIAACVQGPNRWRPQRVAALRYKVLLAQRSALRAVQAFL